MKKIIALISDDFEDLELSYPVLRLREAGCRVDIVGEENIMYITASMGYHFNQI